MFAGLLLCCPFSSSSSFSSFCSSFPSSPPRASSSRSYGLSLLSPDLLLSIISEFHDPTTPPVSLWVSYSVSLVSDSMSPSFLFHFLSVELLPLETFHWVGCRWQLLRSSGSLETVVISLLWLSRFIFLVESLFQSFAWSLLPPKSPMVLLRCEMAFLFVGHLCLFRVWILSATSLYLWGFEILGW